MQTEFAAGTAPDITINQMDWVIPGAARGMFVDLMPFIEADQVDLDAYFYDMEPEWGWQGGLYGGLLYAGDGALRQQGSTGRGGPRNALRRLDVG